MSKNAASFFVLGERARMGRVVVGSLHGRGPGWVGWWSVAYMGEGQD